MQIEQGWLTDVSQKPSPNCDDRPEESDITLIVIHCISLPPGHYGGEFISQLFCNQLNPDAHPYFKAIDRLKVSAHLLIKRTGEIIQYVPFHKRAWHAGVSSYQGRARCNDYSIGIELEGIDTENYTDNQYTVLAEVIALIERTYPQIAYQRIVGHSDIAPGRKTDPGDLFNWQKLKGLLADTKTAD